MNLKRAQAVLATALIVPLISGIFLLRFEDVSYHAHSLHFYYVLISAMVSGVLSFFAYREFRRTENPTVLMVTIAFTGVTIFYAFHGLMTPNYAIFPHHTSSEHLNLFVFYGDLSRFWLAIMLFFSGEMLVQRIKKIGIVRFFVALIIVIASISMLIGYVPAIIPDIKNLDGTDTHFSVLFKVATLVILGVVLLRYYSSFKIKQNVSIMFLIIGLLFVFQSVIIFMISVPWGMVWWMAHNLFLLSYIVITVGLIYNKRKAQSFEYFDVMSEVHAMLDRLDESNKQLTYQVSIDALTGIYNRKYIFDYMESQVNQNPSAPFAVLFVDIDDFKEINDGFGHNVGDEVLKIVASRLQSTTKKDDVVARIGGDEFIVYLHNVKCDNINKVVTRLNTSLNKRITLNNHVFRIKASMGFALYPEDAKTVDDLVQLSDKSMYSKKKHKE